MATQILLLSLLLFVIITVISVRIAANVKQRNFQKKLNSIKAASPYSNIKKKKPAPTTPKDPEAKFKDLNADLGLKTNKHRSANDVIAASQEAKLAAETEEFVELERFNTDVASQGMENDRMVVGQAPAKGKWTRLVAQQNPLKMRAQAEAINKNQGFWQTLVRMLKGSRERDQFKGRGRF